MLSKLKIFSITICIIVLSACSKKENELAESDNWYKGGSTYFNYEIEKSSSEFNGKPVYHITCLSAADTGFGAIMKNIYPGTNTGKRIRLNGWIKTEKMYGTAGMWMRIDGGQGPDMYGTMLAFDNMDNRKITGNNEWKKYDIVLDVPEQSRMIYYGLWLAGLGEVSISDFTIEQVGSDVELTDRR